ncbi:hypothetical protein AGR4B_pAt20087 [Agrobacterium tumefaciens str. CFBP 5621]|nr:hypothetical protein AGR4B_pAt20087 [Agrobacterium tumefaciens str. CFBP 5621]
MKIVFAGIGEIDFICAPRLTNAPTSRIAVRGTEVDLETPGRNHREEGSLSRILSSAT